MPDIYLPGMMNTGVHIPVSKIAKGSPKTIYANPGRPSPGRTHVATSSGGRVQPRAVKAAQKAVKTKAAPSTPTINPNPGLSVPAAPGNPEDAALATPFDPSSLNLTDNASIAGLAGKVQLPNALGYANAMANLQYGDKITALASRIKGLTNALPGSLQALDTAFANIDAQRAQQQIAAPTTSGAGVANLFGGNTGAAAVAANQAVQAGLTAQNQAQGLNDQGAAAARDKADWATRIQLLNNMAVNQGRSDLIAAQGDRDQAKKGYYDQALKTRADMVSQAISNQGAINNQRISSALAPYLVQQAGIKSTSGNLQNALAGIQVAAAPTMTALQIRGQKQNIINSIVSNNINAATATAQLQQLKTSAAKTAPVTTMKDAFSKGAGGAVNALIIPQTAIVPAYNAAGNQTGYGFVGNPNSYLKSGINAIMTQLPGSNRAKVAAYVKNYLNSVLNGTGNKWTLQNGRYVKKAK